MWECALNEFSEMPVLGGNVNNTTERLNSCYRTTGFEYGVSQNYSSHNQYLQTMLIFWTCRPCNFVVLPSIHL